jgi:hypothetical protein
MQMERSMNSSEHAKLARAVVDRWGSYRGNAARDVSSLAAFPLLAEIYALAEGGDDLEMFSFYYLEKQRREPVQLPGEAAPREVLVFADWMICSQEYGVDVATGEVFVLGFRPFLVAPSLEAFFELYLKDSQLIL